MIVPVREYEWLNDECGDSDYDDIDSAMVWVSDISLRRIKKELAEHPDEYDFDWDHPSIALWFRMGKMKRPERRRSDISQGRLAEMNAEQLRESWEQLVQFVEMYEQDWEIVHGSERGEARLLYTSLIWGRWRTGEGFVAGLGLEGAITFVEVQNGSTPGRFGTRHIYPPDGGEE